ncbi:hypothetical protein [Bacillus cihuensis]|uniref:hypothetical protein n=1 Tax=Bacillus cihuensis TaxID=1208599 RepID=UPI0003F4E7C7|nr:hypothetical protein [Bacillus cihuensis]
MKTAEEILEQEISDIKKDLQFLSRKIGVHDMYLNRINKEMEEKEGQLHTAEEMMEIVKNLEKWVSNEERHKFLSEMFYKFYNRSNLPRLPEDWD